MHKRIDPEILEEVMAESNICCNPDEAKFFMFLTSPKGTHAVMMFKNNIPDNEEQEKIRYDLQRMLSEGAFSHTDGIPKEDFDVCYCHTSDANVQVAKAILGNISNIYGLK